MKNESVSQLVLIGMFVVLILATSNSIVRAQGSPPTTSWIGGTGDWFTPENWSGVLPNLIVDAFINNGGQAQIHGGDVDAMAYSLTLGDSQGDSGSLVIDTDHSAVLDIGGACRGNIYVGNRGSGNLTINNEGFIRSRYGYVAALANPTKPNSSGTVKVQGNGTTWYLYDVYNEPGCLGAGLFIGATANSDNGGTALVDVSDGAYISVHNHDQGALYAVKVGVSGTLTGNATLEMVGPTAGSKTANVLGTLAPGRPLIIDGNLNLGFATANTVCHVTPQAWDSVYVTQTTGGGHATLGGRLTVIMTGTFTVGMSFTLVHTEAGLNGTEFQYESINYNNPGGPCISPAINYDANNVKLDLSSCADLEPEPGP